jgi:hypothetical protein
MAKKGIDPVPPPIHQTLCLSPNPNSPLVSQPAYPSSPCSKISHYSRTPHLDGHDGLFPNDDPAARAPAAVDAEVRPRGEETGAVFGAEEGWAVVEVEEEGGKQLIPWGGQFVKKEGGPAAE